jgi:hypothetical protein
MSTEKIREMVRRLARKHFELEEGIESIVWFKDVGNEEIHLIEVNRNTFPEGRILPFYLRPTREFPLPVQIGDITPKEWEKAKSGQIPLPEGWHWDDIESLEREEVVLEASENVVDSITPPQEIEELVRRFVRKLFELEEGIEQIIWFKDGLQDEVRLLEINRDTLPAGKIMTFYHKATLDFPLSVELADATPNEWEKVKSGEMLLPEGWSLHNAQIFERAEGLQGVLTAHAFEPSKALEPFASSMPFVNKEKVDMSTQKIQEMVRRLAREHFEVDESIERIIWFKDTVNQDEIHLIEVNRDIFPEGMVLLFYHKPSHKFPLPLRIADVTPEEWEKVKSGMIPLPEGWSLESMEIFQREEVLQVMDSSLKPEAS